MQGAPSERGRTARALRPVVLLAVGVAAVLLTACGSGHPDGATTTSPAPLTSAPGSGGAAPLVLGPSGRASSTPPAVVSTTMKQFAPLDETGALTAIAHREGAAKCFATSIAVPLSGVYRCLSHNKILDPCFAPAQEQTPATVVCFADPWTEGSIYTLSAALPTYQPVLTTGDPWAIELGNGARCVAVTGAVPSLGDVDLTYRCDTGAVAGLSTDADTGTMTAHYGPLDGPLTDVGVATAWRGRSYRLAG